VSARAPLDFALPAGLDTPTLVIDVGRVGT